MHYLDTPGRKALLRAARLFEKRPLVYETYLDICEKYNVCYRSLKRLLWRVRLTDSFLKMQGGNPESGLDEDEISQQLQIVCRLLARKA